MSLYIIGFPKTQSEEFTDYLVQNNVSKIYCNLNNYLIVGDHSNCNQKLENVCDFNLNNKSKIETIPELAETMSMFWKKWSFLGKRFFIHHDFNHEKYNIRYENPLYKNLRFYKNI